MSYHISGDRSRSLNGNIPISRYPTTFPNHLTGAHLIFCKNPPGSALFTRDIRDYYRNFILSPFTWWKTYGFAMGSFWFNPYLPFGGSSCTLTAQRQSDAIRSIVEAIDIGAKTVAMLDHYLAVVPRREEDTDDTILTRSTAIARDFDTVLRKLGLPTAPEKNQEPSFTTIWHGTEYDSKTGCL